MTTKKLGVLAIAAAAFAAACSDPAGPSARTLQLAEPNAALNPIPYPPATPFPQGDGWVVLCKVSNVAGTFNFDFAVNGAVDGNPDASITVSSGQVNTRVCRSTPLHNSSLGARLIEFVNVYELDPGVDWSTTIDIDQYYVTGVTYNANALLDEWNVTPRTAKVYINDDMQKIVVFNNTYTAPPPPPDVGCTYTKGWYQNKNGAPTVLDGVDGVSKADAQKIFAATPGKPGGVTWGSDNLLLNLYQQFLAALNNLGGDVNEHNGPAAVDQAIDDTRAGTSVSGLAISTTLTHAQMAALVETLSAFNEGTLTGWPHCGG